MEKRSLKYVAELRKSNAKLTKYGVVFKDRGDQLTSPVVKKQNDAIKRIQIKARSKTAETA